MKIGNVNVDKGAYWFSALVGLFLSYCACDQSYLEAIEPNQASHVTNSFVFFWWGALHLKWTWEKNWSYMKGSNIAFAVMLAIGIVAIMFART